MVSPYTSCRLLFEKMKKWDLRKDILLHKNTLLLDEKFICIYCILYALYAPQCNLIYNFILECQNIWIYGIFSTPITCLYCFIIITDKVYKRDGFIAKFFYFYLSEKFLVFNVYTLNVGCYEYMCKTYMFIGSIKN